MFERQKKVEPAEAEFRKILDNPGIVFGFPHAAIARLNLARAYALQGDTTKARAASGWSSSSNRYRARGKL